MGGFSFEPYVKESTSFGSGDSNYDFAGEWTDVTGLQYLRARYMDPVTGRFISRDTWQGDPMQPMGYNLWLYAYANLVLKIQFMGLLVLQKVGLQV